MSKLPYSPFLPPRVDFAVVRNDSKQVHDTFVALGAQAIPKRGYTAYVWGERLGDLFFSGAGILDGEFHVGPRRLEAAPTNFGPGAYSVVRLSDEYAQVSPDLFGLDVVYESDLLVTNRLHLAAMVHTEVDVNSALAATYNDGGFSFSFNHFATPVRGVRIVPAGHEIKVTEFANELTNRLEDRFDRLSVSEYWDLIERGAQSIVDNVNAVASSGIPIFADLSGGKDSRIVYAALVAANRQRDVAINTLANSSNPGLVKDLEIATGLVARFGGTYERRPWPVGYAHSTLEQADIRRRSQLFGGYHWIVPSDLREVTSLTAQPWIKILGGGGELYREYWKPLLFRDAETSRSYEPDTMHSLLQRYQGRAWATEYFEAYRDLILHSFDELPGETLSDKLNAHYLNFRNRYHFGPRQSSPERLIPINVAMVPELLHAARGLPVEDRETGRVTFDVIRCLNEELAYLPHDKPYEGDLRKSAYHKRSRFDDCELNLEPRPELVVPVVPTPGPLRSKMPQTEPLDFEKKLDEMTDRALADLKGGPFEFLLGDETDAFVQWGRLHSPRNRSATTSKLQAFVDWSSSIGG